MLQKHFLKEKSAFYYQSYPTT